MSKLLDLIREQRRRLRGIEDKVYFLYWANFDKEKPCQAFGLQQRSHESYEDFCGRVIVAAKAEGTRFVFLENSRASAKCERISNHATGPNKYERRRRV